MCPPIESNKGFCHTHTKKTLKRLFYFYIDTSNIKQTKKKKKNRRKLCLFKILARKYSNSEQLKKLQDTAYSEDKAESLHDIPTSLFIILRIKVIVYSLNLSEIQYFSNGTLVKARLESQVSRKAAVEALIWCKNTLAWLTFII